MACCNIGYETFENRVDLASAKGEKIANFIAPFLAWNQTIAPRQWHPL